MPSRELEVQKELQLIRAYKEFFNSDNGRLIFRDLTAFARFYKNNQSESHADMSHIQGRQAMILRVMEMINVGEQEMEDMVLLSEEPNHYD